jgi:hypothetical protein
MGLSSALGQWRVEPASTPGAIYANEVFREHGEHDDGKRATDALTREPRKTRYGARQGSSHANDWLRFPFSSSLFPSAMMLTRLSQSSLTLSVVQHTQSSAIVS